MPDKVAANQSDHAPHKGDVLVMGFTEDRVPFLVREHRAPSDAVRMELGQRLKFTNIPERLQFLFEIADTESTIYVRSDVMDDASDDQLLLENGKLVHIYDFVFADEGREVRIEVMDRLRQDELSGLIDQLYGKHPMPALHKNRAATL